MHCPAWPAGWWNTMDGAEAEQAIQYQWWATASIFSIILSDVDLEAPVQADWHRGHTTWAPSFLRGKGFKNLFISRQMRPKGFHPFFCKHHTSSVVPCLVLRVPAQDQSLSLLRLQHCSNPIIRSAWECTLPAISWQILHLHKQTKWWALVKLRLLHFALTTLLFYRLVIVPEYTLSINYNFWQDDLLSSINDDWQVRSSLFFPSQFYSEQNVMNKNSISVAKISSH